MTIEEVKQIIANSKFDTDLKNRLALLLPRLGKYSLSGLGKEVSRGDALIIADYLVSLWERFASILDGIKKTNEDSFKNLSKLLTESLAKSNGEDEFYTLNLVLDIRSLARAKLTAELNKQLLDYEVWLFWQLPKNEVLFLLQNHILYLSQNLNLLKDAQAAVYTNDWDYTKGFPQIFSDALLQNKEMLGQNSKRTVADWIKECINYSTGNKTHMTTFQVAGFLAKDASVQKLTRAEKTSLSEMLKLYVWFLDPQIDEDEIAKYKEEAREEKFAQIEQVNNQTTQKFQLPKEVLGKESQMNSARPTQAPGGGMGPVAPVKKNLGNQKPAEAGLVGSNRVQEPDLSSDKRLAQVQKTVKSGIPNGGDEGNRTPRAWNDKSGSAPSHPQPNSLYHKPVNIQDILRNRFRQAGAGEERAGLRMGDGVIPNSKYQIPNGDKQPRQTPNLQYPISNFQAEGEIDRKLEELRKRAKGNN